MKKRDSQRSQVYEAEALVRRIFDRADERELRSVELLGSHLTLPIERKFASLESVQTYVDAILQLNWVRATWTRARVPVHVRERAGGTAAHYESDCATMAFPVHRGGTAWALRELVVLHELAHHLEPADQDFTDTPPHGGPFVDRYVRLVSEIIGSEAGFVLRATMLEAGVSIG